MPDTLVTAATVTLRGGRSRQVHRGGRGPDLVWLHGLYGVDPAAAFPAALAARHRVTAPTAPGYVDLDELDDIDTVHDLALDYDDLLEEQGLRDIVLVGHSLGAMAAAEIAAHFPARVRKLVLLSPVGLWNDAYPVADLFGRPAAEIDALLWQDAAARDAHAARKAAKAETLGLADRLIAEARTLTAASKFVWPIPDKGLRRRLPRIAAPTLVVFGAEDRFVPPRYAEDFAAGLRHGETVVVAGAGHMLPEEKAEEVAEMIARFLG